MNRIVVDAKVIPLAPFGGEDRTMIALGASLDCPDLASCRALYSLWTEELGMIAENLRVRYGSHCASSHHRIKSLTDNFLY